MNLLLASNNTHKIREISHFLAPLGIHCLSPLDLAIDIDVNECGQSFAQNAYIKAKTYSQLIRQAYPVLSDDSGLCVDILDGQPGIHSARYGNNLTKDKTLQSTDRNKLLLKNLKDFDKPHAYFVCHLCLYYSPYSYVSIEECLEGYVAEAPKLKNLHGFGYDPIFYLKDTHKSLGEYSLEEKNTISARGKALAKLGLFLRGKNQ